MALNDLAPWGRKRTLPAPRFTGDGDPLVALHRETNRMFDNFARGFGFGLPSRFGFSAAWPNVEVSETDDEVKVEAELPGVEQKDVDVSLADGVLTIRGERKAETNGSFYSERWAGKFQRSLEVGDDVDPDKASAVFKNGVLTVTVPKRPEAQRQVKSIPVAA